MTQEIPKIWQDTNGKSLFSALEKGSLSHEKISHKEIKVGMMIFSSDEKHLLFVTGCVDTLTKSYISHITENIWSSVDWMLYPHSLYYLIGGQSTEPAAVTRKDYCHTCKTDKLVWNMMAARCCSCNKIILGG